MQLEPFLMKAIALPLSFSLLTFKLDFFHFRLSWKTAYKQKMDIVRNVSVSVKTGRLSDLHNQGRTDNT